MEEILSIKLILKILKDQKISSNYYNKIAAEFQETHEALGGDYYWFKHVNLWVAELGNLL